MTVIVCPLHEVPDQLLQSKPARMISLLSPDQPAPEALADMPRLVLRFHDIGEPREGLIAPDRAMIIDLLAFGAAWREPGPLLIHCWMGVSRSPAAALALACALDPTRDEADIANTLRQASPIATPNPLMIALADGLMQREGRLIAASAQIGRGAEALHGTAFRFPGRPASLERLPVST